MSNVYTDIKCLAHNRRKEACYNYIIIIYLDMLDILDMRIYWYVVYIKSGRYICSIILVIINKTGCIKDYGQS